MGLITHAENLHTQKKKVQGSYKTRIIKAGSGRDITESQKKENQEKANKRIGVEHLIRLVKIFRVAAERFRLKPENYELVIRAVCGLVRWRIGAIVICQ